MKQVPVWTEGAYKKSYQQLDQDIIVDVAIIGGGITGITAAYLLKQAGRKVAVLEALSVGSGTTGVSTGNLYATTAERFDTLKSKYDKETIRKVAKSRAAAVNLIEHVVNDHGINCEFHRAPWYLFAEHKDDVSTIEKELEAIKDAGLDAHFVKTLPTEAPTLGGIKLDMQAQLNPLKYVRGLAEETHSPDSMVYEYTKIVDYKEGEKGNPCVLHTDRGHRITALHVIMATHTPKGVMFVQTLLGPYREYAIAVSLADNIYPQGIFWGMTQGKRHSVRSYTSAEGKSHLLILGEPHKVGQKENNEECLKQLEIYARERFKVAEIEYYWGGQHYRPADGLPYIGPNGEDSNIYIATGFATDGLVWGTLAAMLISDHIMGKDNEWLKLYDFNRHNPGKAAKEFVKENTNVMVQYMKDLPNMNLDAKEFSEIKAGEGKTIAINGEKYAAYRDTENNLHVVSAVCTHMKCVVHWNSAEKTWDCPCHGSRFNTNGQVLEGPAIHDLPRREDTHKDREGGTATASK